MYFLEYDFSTFSQCNDLCMYVDYYYWLFIYDFSIYIACLILLLCVRYILYVLSISRFATYCFSILYALKSTKFNLWCYDFKTCRIEKIYVAKQAKIKHENMWYVIIIICLLYALFVLGTFGVIMIKVMIMM